MAQENRKMGLVEGAQLSQHISPEGFATMPEARIEFNISDTGLHIVANEAGWRTLESWCSRMASATVERDATGTECSSFELYPDIVPERMLVSDSVLTSFWGLGSNVDEERDVYLHKSTVIGPEYWRGTGVKSGTSPGTHAFASQMYWALDDLRGSSLEDAVSRLGAPFVQTPGIAYFTPDMVIRSKVPQFDMAGMLIELGIESGVVDTVNWIMRSELGGLVDAGGCESTDIACVNDDHGLTTP